MNLGLKNKYALITGGSHGLGRSTALALANEGCNVAICARSEDRLKMTLNEISNTGVECLAIVADATKKEDVDRTIKTVIDNFGTLHILINNVGGGGRWGKEDVETTDESIWLEVYNKNALAAIRFTMGILKNMKNQKWGRVITISSTSGKEGGARPWFAMAKTAEISLMKSLALNKSLVRFGITFNTVAPGNLMIPDTGWEIESKENPDGFKRMLEEKPLGRLGTPEEVADVITFLCSERAGLINGSCIVIDGGETRSF